MSNKENVDRSQSKPPITESPSNQKDHTPKKPDSFTWNDLGEIVSDVGKVVVDVLIDIVS